MHEANARTALAGNPSDGYGGAVLAVTIDTLGARVELGGDGPSGDEALLTAATLARFDREFGVRTSLDAGAAGAAGAAGGAGGESGAGGAGGLPRMRTDIPREVGLGGSSAIVIATLRALCHHHRVGLEPGVLAALALSIEVDDLGIAAGLQDRLVQSHGGLVFMEFGGAGPHAEVLDRALLPPLLVAWRADHGEHSGVVHADLRERFQRGEPGVREAMAQLAGLARRARAALLSGALEGFRAAVDASYELRAQLLELNPRHVEMVELGRRAGAAVNYTGSGGAVVCVCDDPGHRSAVARALRESGCETVEL